MTGKVRFSAVLVKPLIFIAPWIRAWSPGLRLEVGTAAQVPSLPFWPIRRYE